MATLSRSLSTLLYGLLLAALSGCTLVGSVHPLADAKTSIKDDRLVGEWISLDPKTNEPKNGEERLTIRAAAGGGYEGVNPGQPETAHIFVAELGERFFLSAEARSEDAEVRFLLLQYEVRDDQIHMFLLDPERTSAAISQGLIDGTVERDAPPDDDPNAEAKLKEVMLTASTAELRKFFATKPGQAIIHAEEPALILKRAAK